MTKIKATVQAIVDAGSYRKARSRVGGSISTMSLIKQAGEKAGLTLEQMLELPEEKLSAIVYGDVGDGRPLPDFEKVSEAQAKYPKLTIKAIHEEYVRSAGFGAYSYERFCSLYRLWREENETVRAQSNLSYWMAQREECDFSGNKIKWRDYNGVEHESELFVACFSFSGALFAYATVDQKQPSWLEALIMSFYYFGGCCSLLVFDNAKAMVKEVTRDGSVVQEGVQLFCEHYFMEPCPCPPKAPRCKAKVEFSVGFLQRKAMAEKDWKEGGFVARDRTDLNRQLAKYCDVLNSLETNREKRSRSELLEDERPFLIALPPTPYEIGEDRYATADKRHCVLVIGDGNHRYSVPPDHAGRRVFIHITHDRVRIYEENSTTLLGDHLRRTELYGEKTHVLPEHMTGREKFCRMSRGEITEAIVAAGIDRKSVEAYTELAWQNPRQGRKVSQAALKACKVYKATAVQWAMKICVSAKTANNRLLCKLARESESRADIDSRDQSAKDYHTPAHDNIRNDYE